MTMQSQIKEHYRGQALRPEKLAELTALTTPRWERWALPAAVAAIVLVAVSLANSLPDLTTAIGEEIANNHRRELAPEFAVSRFDEISAHMGRLDFEPRRPERLADRGLRVVGVRYCKVQGRIAAQVRLTDAGGRIHTLYLVRAFGGVRDSSEPHDGVTVELWREGDLLVGLAHGDQS